jgi:putative transposase
VTWYNHAHHHSAIQSVTPDDRHTGRDVAILAQRAAAYQAARADHPERWRGNTRDWSRPTTVSLNDARSATVDVVAGSHVIRQLS